ncbi:MAG: leucyl aminopeptidase [Longimonas sp.]|uniref:leucyl aminopeptidase family protein n=1 Tax=Longimonas sp. TaxID=2039626 RepID=UPI0039767877
MTVTATSASPASLSVDAWVVPLARPVASADEEALTNTLGASFAQALRVLGDEHGDTVVIYPEAPEAERIIFVNCGAIDEVDAESLRRAAASTAETLRDAHATDVGLVMPTLPIEARTATQALVEGLVLAHYRYTAYKTDRDDVAPVLNALHVAYRPDHDEAAVEDGAARGQHVAAATCSARDLVNRSPHEKTARHLAAAIKDSGHAHGYTVETWNRDRIEDEGMGGLLAVNRGSVEPPTFSVLEWAPDQAVNDRPVVLVGKGVVFDTGGLSLKPTKDSMDFMKADMGGAAAVMGTFEAVASLNLPVHLIGLVPATDNRPGQHAYVPGEVVTMHSGATVEVMNTDAEGRMLLADALSYARRYTPALVVDLATLTGAAVTALGHYASAVMTSNTPDAAERLYALQRAGERTGDRVHPLPLYDDYNEQLKSDIADLTNVGGRPAGAITAGKFLEHFVDYPWMHIDIASTAFLSSAQPYRPKGGTGAGVRLLTDYLERYADAQSIA